MPFLIEEYLKDRAQQVELTLDRLLPHEWDSPSVIVESIRYSLFAGGKRIRPVLCLAVAETLGQAWKQALPIAASIEMIHTYSLIHDDLPAMDNDDYRRGKLTNHKVFGDAIAILAGDGLLTYAFETLANAAQPGEERKIIKIIAELAKASGIEGMIGGQAADIQAEGTVADRVLLDYIHKHKTGDLLTASVRIGAISADASDQNLQALTTFADRLGLAFQIQDDILDVVGDQAKLGKQVGADAAHGKMTYPAVYGIAASRQKLQQLTNEAFENLDRLPHDTTILRAIADFLVRRDF